MRPRVVISGSFHRAPEQLRRIFRELEATGCRILSPVTLDFVTPSASFVRTSGEQDLTDAEVERFHLRALRDAQFVWLHAPNGYVGIGAAYEIGYASALAIPVFCREDEAPADPVVRPRVTPVRSVFDALESLG